MSSKDRSSRYCALAYTPPAARKLLSVEGQFVMVFMELGEESLKVSILPDWERKVASEDHEYLAELMDDWRLRAAAEPGELFAQVASVTVGPLVPTESGIDGPDEPLMQIVRTFTVL